MCYAIYIKEVLGINAIWRQRLGSHGSFGFDLPAVLSYPRGSLEDRIGV